MVGHIFLPEPNSRSDSFVRYRVSRIFYDRALHLRQAIPGIRIVQIFGIDPTLAGLLRVARYVRRSFLADRVDDDLSVDSPRLSEVVDALPSDILWMRTIRGIVFWLI